jgi:hypothetical protein
MDNQATTDIERILEKVKKCLALAESDNAGESAAALRQARKLMEKHGITETAVKLSEVQAVRVEKTPAAKDRAGRLVATVAGAFSCRPLRNRVDGNVVFEFIGKGVSPEIAAYTWDVLWRRLEMERTAFHEQMLCSLIDPAWDDEIHSHRFQWAKEDARKATTSFVEGWLHNVAAVVREFAAPEPDKDVKDWMAQKYGKLGKHTPRKAGNLDADGVQAGLDAGSRVRLHHGVNGTAASQRMLA